MTQDKAVDPCMKLAGREIVGLSILLIWCYIVSDYVPSIIFRHGICLFMKYTIFFQFEIFCPTLKKFLN
jgi:hypothetical protein